MTFYDSSEVAGVAQSPGGDRILFSADCMYPEYLGLTFRILDVKASRYCYGTIVELLSASLIRVVWEGPAMAPGQKTTLWEGPALNARDGYFRSVAIHDGRLCFGGALSASNTVFLSKSGQFRSFDLGIGADSDAIAVTASGAIRTIRHLVDAGTGLLILTEGGSAMLGRGTQQALTPTSAAFEPVSQHGIGQVRPAVFDGGVIMVVAGGASVRDIAYQAVADKQVSTPLSLPATGFLNTLVDAAYLDHADGRPEEIAFFLNSLGEIILYHSIRSQSVGAWMPWRTTGKWTAIAVVGQRLYAVSQRVAGEWRLELFDAAVPFDSARYWQSNAPAERLAIPHIPPGWLVHACAGDDYLGSGFTAPEGVLVERQRTLVPDLGQGFGYIGLAFDWRIIPLPPVVDLPDGSLLQRPQRLVRIGLRLENTLSVSVAGEELQLADDGFEVTTAPVRRSGWWHVRQLGWDRLGDQESAALVPPISRGIPMPVKLLALKREIKA